MQILDLISYEHCCFLGHNFCLLKRLSCMLTHFSLVHWDEPLDLFTLSLDDSSDMVSCVRVCVCVCTFRIA